jgi:hypothetical protein
VEGSVPKANAAPRALGNNLTNSATGQRIAVPAGANTMTRVASGKGVQISGGTGGGNGLANSVTSIRVMEPNAQNPTGYVRYQNAAGHAVEPSTGQQVGSGIATPKNTHIPIEK